MKIYLLILITHMTYKTPPGSIPCGNYSCNINIAYHRENKSSMVQTKLIQKLTTSSDQNVILFS